MENFDINADDAIGKKVEIKDTFSGLQRKAVVSDVDFDEGEILVTFDNGCQEWINPARCSVSVCKQISSGDFYLLDDDDVSSEKTFKETTFDSGNASNEFEEVLGAEESTTRLETSDITYEWNNADLKKTVQEIIEHKKRQRSHMEENDSPSSEPDWKGFPSQESAEVKRVTFVRMKRKHDHKARPKDGKPYTDNTKADIGEYREFTGDVYERSPVITLPKAAVSEQETLTKGSPSNTIIIKRRSKTHDSGKKKKSRMSNQITGSSAEDVDIGDASRDVVSNQSYSYYETPRHFTKDAPSSVHEERISAAVETRPEKLPTLKIKLTRSTLDGSSGTKDTFVVTESTADPNYVPNDQQYPKPSKLVQRRKIFGKERAQKRKWKYPGVMPEQSSSKKRKLFTESSHREGQSQSSNWTPSVRLPPPSITDRKALKYITQKQPRESEFDIPSLAKAAERSRSPQFPPVAKKRIKMLLPKVKLPPMSPAAPGPHSVNFSSPATGFEPRSAGVEATAFICPRKNCRKQFRTENLLMMHIKHYHMEYKKLLSSTPNVADLAYARTIGETIYTPQSEFLQQISKLEEDKWKEEIEQKYSDEAFGRLEKQEVQSTIGTSFNRGGTPVSSSVPDVDRSMGIPLARSLFPKCEPKDSILSPKSEHSETAESTTSSALDEGKNGGDRKNKKPRQMVARDIINCLCGYGDEDGLMVQCEVCLCWQHGSCNGIEQEADVPVDYVCKMCRNPRREYSSRKYSYMRYWFTEGRLPCYDTCKIDATLHAERESFMKETHRIVGRLVELQNVLHSLKVKNHIMGQVTDHPKLYLWSKPWNEKKLEEEQKSMDNRKNASDGPVPEAAINMKVCRKNLCEHIEEEIHLLEDRLSDVEKQIDDLAYESGEEYDEQNTDSEDEVNAKDVFRFMSTTLAAV